MTISHGMRTYTQLCVSTRIFRVALGFTGEMSLSRDGAVGARVIQASVHVRLGGGVLSNSSPQLLIRDSTQIGGDFSPEGGGFARDCTKPAEFLAPLTAFFT